MLAAEAIRLAAIEVLCPTAALASGQGFPTLAGKNVFDSRVVALQDLDPDRDYTPVLSLYTQSSSMVQRGEAAAADDMECQAVLEVVAELATSFTDEDGVQMADAMAGADPEARLVLGALVSQVRYLLEFAPSGFLFRQTRIAIRRFEQETFAVPDLGLRWHRVTMRVTIAIPADEFDLVNGGMPEPIKTLCDSLPDGSYAKAKMVALGAHFAGASPLVPLEGVAIFDGVDADPQTDAPIATIGEIDVDD